MRLLVYIFICPLDSFLFSSEIAFMFFGIFSSVIFVIKLDIPQTLVIF